jgi:hypothetical protein
MRADGAEISLAGATGDATELIVSFVVIADAASVGVEPVSEEELLRFSHRRQPDCCSLP